MTDAVATALPFLSIKNIQETAQVKVRAVHVVGGASLLALWWDFVAVKGLFSVFAYSTNQSIGFHPELLL